MTTLLAIFTDNISYAIMSLVSLYTVKREDIIEDKLDVLLYAPKNGFVDELWIKPCPGNPARNCIALPKFYGYSIDMNIEYVETDMMHPSRAIEEALDEFIRRNAERDYDKLILATVFFEDRGEFIHLMNDIIQLLFAKADSIINSNSLSEIVIFTSRYYAEILRGNKNLILLENKLRRGNITLRVVEVPFIIQTNSTIHILKRLVPVCRIDEEKRIKWNRVIIYACLPNDFTLLMDFLNKAYCSIQRFLKDNINDDEWPDSQVTYMNMLRELLYNLKSLELEVGDFEIEKLTINPCLRIPICNKLRQLAIVRIKKRKEELKEDKLKAIINADIVIREPLEREAQGQVDELVMDVKTPDSPLGTLCNKTLIPHVEASITPRRSKHTKNVAKEKVRFSACLEQRSYFKLVTHWNREASFLSSMCARGNDCHEVEQTLREFLTNVPLWEPVNCPYVKDRELVAVRLLSLSAYPCESCGVFGNEGKKVAKRLYVEATFEIPVIEHVNGSESYAELKMEDSNDGILIRRIRDEETGVGVGRRFCDIDYCPTIPNLVVVENPRCCDRRYVNAGTLGRAENRISHHVTVNLLYSRNNRRIPLVSELLRNEKRLDKVIFGRKVWGKKDGTNAYKILTKYLRDWNHITLKREETIKNLEKFLGEEASNIEVEINGTHVESHVIKLDELVKKLAESYSFSDVDQMYRYIAEKTLALFSVRSVYYIEQDLKRREVLKNEDVRALVTIVLVESLEYMLKDALTYY